MTAHKHAHLMARYAQDAAETETPWERWQFRGLDTERWLDCTSRIGFSNFYEYRRKPRTMTYKVTIPEPLREEPGVGEAYYIAAPDATGFCIEYVWTECGTNIRGFKRGLCFTTKEDAIAAAKAMMPIKGEEA